MEPLRASHVERAWLDWFIGLDEELVERLPEDGVGVDVRLYSVPISVVGELACQRRQLLELVVEREVPVVAVDDTSVLERRQ